MHARVSAKPQRKRAGFSASANGCRRQRQGRGPCGQADDGATDSPPRGCRQGGGITTLRECAHPTRRNGVATSKPRQRRGGGRGATVPVAASGAPDLLHRTLASARNPQGFGRRPEPACGRQSEQGRRPGRYGRGAEGGLPLLLILKLILKTSGNNEQTGKNRNNASRTQEQMRGICMQMRVRRRRGESGYAAGVPALPGSPEGNALPGFCRSGHGLRNRLPLQHQSEIQRP